MLGMMAVTSRCSLNWIRRDTTSGCVARAHSPIHVVVAARLPDAFGEKSSGRVQEREPHHQ